MQHNVGHKFTKQTETQVTQQSMELYQHGQPVESKPFYDSPLPHHLQDLMHSVSITIQLQFCTGTMAKHSQYETWLQTVNFNYRTCHKSTQCRKLMTYKQFPFPRCFKWVCLSILLYYFFLVF